MGFNFPNAPSSGDIYDFDGTSYRFDGTRWKLLSKSINYSGDKLVSANNECVIDLDIGNFFEITTSESTTISFINPPPETSAQKFYIKFNVLQDYDELLNIGYRIDVASYDNKFFNTFVSGVSSSTNANVSNSLFFKPDGTKMYTIDTGNDRILQYALSTPWDISTALYDSAFFSASSQDSVPYEIFFKPDGTKMYIIGLTNDSVYQYSLSTPWDISTALYDSEFFSVSSQDSVPNGIFFKPDGTKMYISGFTNDSVYQYSLSTPWDISTSVYDDLFFDYSALIPSSAGIFFKPDGTKMYIIGLANDSVYQYSLSTPWDISTSVYDDLFFDVSGLISSSAGIFFKSDGTKMYILDRTVNRVYQYSAQIENIVDITWPNSIRWDNDTTPYIIGADNVNLLEFYTSNAGITYYGKLSGDNLS